MCEALTTARWTRPEASFQSSPLSTACSNSSIASSMVSRSPGVATSAASSMPAPRGSGEGPRSRPSVMRSVRLRTSSACRSGCDIPSGCASARITAVGRSRPTRPSASRILRASRTVGRLTPSARREFSLRGKARRAVDRIDHCRAQLVGNLVDHGSTDKRLKLHRAGTPPYLLDLQTLPWHPTKLGKPVRGRGAERGEVDRCEPALWALGSTLAGNEQSPMMPPRVGRSDRGRLTFRGRGSCDNGDFIRDR